MLLYVDEKGPVTAAKTHGGTSWSSVQVKIEKAQKIKRILNVFEVYDLTNDKIHMYNAIKGRQGRNSLSTLKKRIDRRYHENVQNIFIVIDNL